MIQNLAMDLGKDPEALVDDSDEDDDDYVPGANVEDGEYLLCST